MPDKARIGRRDYSRELSSMDINIVDLTAANLAAQQALLTALQAAATNMVRGIPAFVEAVIIDNGSSTPPTDETIQNETGWLIIYADNQAFLDPGTDTVPNPGFGEVYQLYWPCANYTDHLVDGQDVADLAQADIAAFVTAFEAYQRSPYGGTITVTEMAVSGADT